MHWLKYAASIKKASSFNRAVFFWNWIEYEITHS